MQRSRGSTKSAPSRCRILTGTSRNSPAIAIRRRSTCGRIGVLFCWFGFGPLLLHGLQAHLLINLLEALLHLLEPLEFRQLLLRFGGTPRGPVHQGEAVVGDRGERF